MNRAAVESEDDSLFAPAVRALPVVPEFQDQRHNHNDSEDYVKHTVGCIITLSFRLYELSQRRLRQPLNRPLVQRNGSDGAVDRQGWLVPVEADPFHAAATAFQSKIAQVFQHGLAIAAPAFFREDKQVFQIESLPPQEGGEVVEE